MRHHQPDEADRPGHRHRRAAEQRNRQQAQQPRLDEINAKAQRHLIPQRQHVEAWGNEQRDAKADQRRDQRRLQRAPVQSGQVAGQPGAHRQQRLFIEN